MSAYNAAGIKIVYPGINGCARTVCYCLMMDMDILCYSMYINEHDHVQFRVIADIVGVKLPGVPWYLD